MRCQCGQSMRPRPVQFVARLHGRGPRVLVSGMPAWECPDCGEQVADAPIFDAVARLLGPAEPLRQHALPSRI